MIQQEFNNINLLIGEKNQSLTSALPIEIKTLTMDLQSFHESIISRLHSLLPQGEAQIHAITLYIIQCRSGKYSEAKKVLSSEEIEVEEEEEEGKKVSMEVFLTLQDIRQSLQNLQTSLKEKNSEAVRAKVESLISSYGYAIPGSLQLVEAKAD
jgi:hypothetical protein